MIIICILFIQEGPDSICVFGQKSRTNNLVESHNAYLNKIINCGSNLFTVVSKLMIDETRKVHDMRLVLDGAIGVYREPDKVYKKRSAFIEKEQDNLLKNEIDVDEFMSRLTFKYNPVSYNMTNFEAGNVSSDEDEVLEQMINLGDQLPGGALMRLVD